MSNDTKLVSYDFLAPRQIVFGWGRRVEIGPLARNLGRRAFLVVGSKFLENNGTIDEVCDLLDQAGVEPTPLASIHREPEIVDVDETAARLRERLSDEGDLLIAVGGGSAIDLAKAVSAMATNRQSETVRDYLEGIGKGLAIEERPIPLLAMPTTAGTGSEATKNAVISSADPPVKKSLRSEWMVPQAVLIDPELTVSVPAETTAHTGMDAITQLIESYISIRSKPIPDALCLQGLALAIPALPVAVKNPTVRDARECMAHAALLSGMALANSGLGMAHGVAAALGIHADVPHGLACAVMLPAALRTNMEVSQVKLARLARLLRDDCPDDDLEAAQLFVTQIEKLCRDIGIPSRLGAIGVEKNQLEAIVASSRGNSMSGNPRELSDDELTAILGGML